MRGAGPIPPTKDSASRTHDDRVHGCDRGGGAVLKGARQLHARCAPLSYAAHIYSVWGLCNEFRRDIVQQSHGISARAVNPFLASESS
jgi:hypothetical protein